MAETCTIEMGKPITESYAEIDECVKLLDYYANHSADHVHNEELDLITGHKA